MFRIGSISTSNFTQSTLAVNELVQSRYIVKKLYKELLYLGRISFLGVDYVRDRAKPQFLKNANLTDIDEINKCIERTKYVIKEVEAMNKFHKYRHLKKSYEFNEYLDNFTKEKFNDQI
ncbi:hypothetical protein DLAC_07747 [Tieghemostelium lacteum]|uniref:LYR motif-containing protein 5 n=1 Tax=Tieghemostelium lacteum TaxID=361077 RepID=A0A151ZAB4_TIELA|nr:hypothetical protein DLAC_07747 [Tieghemostelium lacteum]|eukprot:KYQ90876.1 hypothetical protein DLAC_07747 [Tieghemostelium lacteum]